MLQTSLLQRWNLILIKLLISIKLNIVNIVKHFNNINSTSAKVHAPECYRNHEGYQADLQDFWQRQDFKNVHGRKSHDFQNVWLCFWCGQFLLFLTMFREPDHSCWKWVSQDISSLIQKGKHPQQKCFLLGIAPKNPNIIQRSLPHPGNRSSQRHCRSSSTLWNSHQCAPGNDCKYFLGSQNITINFFTACDHSNLHTGWSTWQTYLKVNIETWTHSERK